MMLLEAVIIITLVWAARAQSPATVTIAAKDATLFFRNEAIGSTQEGSTAFSGLIPNVKDGDTITIVARNVKGKKGIIAAVKVGGRHYVTQPSTGPWRVLRTDSVAQGEFPPIGVPNCDWKLPSFSKIRPGTKDAAVGYPYQNGAAYVWAARGGADDTIVLRYTFGKDPCRAQICFDNDNFAQQFVNGKLITDNRNHVRNWFCGKRIMLNVKPGDVIAFRVEALGGLHRITADLEILGENFVTKVGEGPWKLIKKFTDDSSWMKPGYSSCSWKYGISAWRPPYGLCSITDCHGAHPVWAEGAVSTDTIFARFVVGGETCT